eukprot:CAMPEP_0174732920 /NCGR_PEP_ID=MMETSP1094-20130205/60297_1 /TAXON_ID=156173 /ORGANISM="Chrysochromulina brevifilum, Strain UTEX LB 985" /LENGTH=120 /DNA_ID=CAMNT_0015935497 /DNA_START=162 /DNA_END=524 /DNA_ORIENTATION=+
MSGGTAETVAAALTSTNVTQLPTDEQLDLLLPSDGFEVVAPPSTTPVNSDPLKMSAAEVDLFFIARVGPFDQAYDVMCKMQLDELEDLQGIADNIRAGGLDDGAQQRGLSWSTLISRIVA